MNGSIYERELAAILSGSRSAVERFTKKIPPEDRGVVSTIIRRPFFVTRSAGSLGADLIAVRHDFSLIIEVKSSQKRTIAFSDSSGKRQEQAERLNLRCQQAGLFLMYAFRLKGIKGDRWRLFSVEGDPAGRLKLLYNILPRLHTTASNNYSLRWEEGMPLVSFIKYVNMEYMD